MKIEKRNERKNWKSSLWMRRYRNFERSKLLFSWEFLAEIRFYFFRDSLAVSAGADSDDREFPHPRRRRSRKKNHTQISISVVSVCEDFRNLRSSFLSTLIWFIAQVRVSTDSERSLMCREMLKLSLSLSEDLSLFEDCCRCRRYLLPFTLPPRQSQSSVALIMTHQVVSGRNRLLFFCLKFPLWLGLNWPATDRSDLDSFARCHKFARLSWSWLEVITYGQSEKY